MDIGIPTLNSRGKWRKAPFQFGLSTGLSGSGHVPVVYFDLYQSAPTCVVAGIAPNVSVKHRHRSHVFVHAKSDGVVPADRPRCGLTDPSGDAPGQHRWHSSNRRRCRESRRSECALTVGEDGFATTQHRRATPPPDRPGTSVEPACAASSAPPAMHRFPGRLARCPPAGCAWRT